MAIWVTTALHRQFPAVRETLEGLFRHRKSVAEREGFSPPSPWLAQRHAQSLRRAIRKNTLAEALGNLRDRPVRGDSFRFCLEFASGLSGFRALAITLHPFVKNRSESLLTVGSYLLFDLK